MRFNTLLLACLLTAPAYAADSYTHYKNERFGFGVDIPTNLFKPQGESDNGDGQTFSYNNGLAQINVYGGWLMEPDIPCAASHVFAQKNVNTTYLKSGPLVSVVSGYKGSNIFYVKTIRTSDRCLNLSIIYPSNDKARFDEVVKHVSRSFNGE